MHIYRHKNTFRRSTLNIHWKDWCWSWSSNILATWCKEPTHWKSPWCWERLRAGGEGDDSMDISLSKLQKLVDYREACHCCSPWGRKELDTTEWRNNKNTCLCLVNKPVNGQTTHRAAAAKSLQLCLTLCDPIDGSPLGSPVPGILQARTLEWVAISFSNAWKWKVKVKSLSRVWLFSTPQAAAYQAPLSMGSSRQEYWSGVPLPSPTYTAGLSEMGRRKTKIKGNFMAVQWLGLCYVPRFDPWSGN